MNNLAAGANMDEVIGEFRFGKELWQLFLWIAVMLFIAEILLSRGSVQEEQ